MKNINRDYLVTVNAKTAEIDPPNNMKFYITDILTCNIFFQLVFNEPHNLITSYAPNEDSSNYSLKLRVVKPNNDIKEVDVEPLPQGGDFFVANLTPSFTDYIGTYECELFIDTEINGYAERSTTDSFIYEVEKSIFTAVDEIIEGDPDYPGILDSFATKDYVDSHIDNQIKNMDLYGYATRDYVNQVIVGGEIDLDNLVTDQELNDAISQFVGGSIDLSEYVTEEELAEALANFSGNGGDIDLSEYVTETELAMKNYITSSQIPTSLPANGGNADTVDGFNVWMGTQAQYDAIYYKDPSVIYFIEEED